MRLFERILISMLVPNVPIIGDIHSYSKNRLKIPNLEGGAAG